MNVDVNGPKIIFTIPLFGGINVTETIVNGWIVMGVITLLCIFLTRNLSVRHPSKKQLIVEKLYLMLQNLVKDVMGEKNLKYVPYIGTLFTFSIIGSLSSLVGMRPMTGDLNTTLGWAIITFVIIQTVNIRYHGVGGWLKSFTQPVPAISFLNVISEFANPVSMAFRHFGNIASGIVITTLVYGALASLSKLILGFIPNDFISSIPIFQVGLPAILSIYFDLFTSFLQAYIFSMLTMTYVASVAE